MNFNLVAKLDFSVETQERIYAAMNILEDIADGISKTGVADETAKKIGETVEILKDIIRTGIVAD